MQSVSEELVTALVLMALLIESRLYLVWAKQHSQLFSVLSFNITREVAAYLPPSFPLLWVEKDHIWHYDLQLGKVSAPRPLLPKQTPFQVSRRSGWVVLDSGRALVCGGGDGRTYTALEVWKTAYLVHGSGEVDSLPSLSNSHSSFGIVFWQGSVHVFGSYFPDGDKKCERLGMAEAEGWCSLPDMKESRTLFTPAVWRGAVYLCGGWTTTVEVWDGERMMMLELRLPEAERTMACVYKDKVLVLSYRYLSTISAQAGQLTLATKKHPSYYFHTSTNPVVYAGLLYHIHDREVSRFALEDGHRLE